MSSIKSMVGHSLGAIGAIEIAASRAGHRAQRRSADRQPARARPRIDLDYVPLHAREQRSDAVLTVGSGFGGFQTAMLLARPGMVASHG